MEHPQTQFSPEEIRDAIEESLGQPRIQPLPPPPRKSVKWVISASQLPWLQINLDTPHSSMLKEARSMDEHFTYDMPRKTYRWSVLPLITLEGLRVVDSYESCQFLKKTRSPSKNPLLTNGMPQTEKFLSQSIFSNIFAAEVTRLEPGGMIYPHQDHPDHRLDRLIVALNAPEKCDFYFESFGKLPILQGQAFLIDSGYVHCVQNKSNEVRYHLHLLGDFRESNFLLSANS